MRAPALPIAQAKVAEDPHVLVDYVRAAPGAYLHYVQTIYNESPWHVAVETFLIVFILYILLVKRSYNPQKR